MILIMAVLFALGIAFFATQNTGVVTLRLANYIFPAVPLYIVMAISLLMGLFVAWLVGLVDSLSSSFALRGKDSRLRQADSTITTLKDKIHELEVENAHLKGDVHSEDVIHESQEDLAYGIRSGNKNSSLFPNFPPLFR